jgi:DNA-binding response OmpR family regulator
MQILLIEDDDRVRELVALTLRDAGFTVLEASRAEQAFELMKTTVPELILLDLGMPSGAMSGVEALAQIHERAEWASIPIVVLSGFGELLNPDVVARLGVREVLQKPLLGTAIVNAVRKALAS